MHKSTIVVSLCAAALSGCLSVPPNGGADGASRATAQAVASTRPNYVHRPVSLRASDRRAIEAEIRDVAAARRITLGAWVAVSLEHEDPDAFGRTNDSDLYVCGWFTVQDWEADAPERMRQDGEIAFYATNSYSYTDWWVNTANFTVDDLPTRCLSAGVLLQNAGQGG